MDEKEIRTKFNEIEARLSNIEGLFEKKGSEIILDKGNQIFDVEGDKLTLTRSLGTKTDEKTQNIALLVLLGYKIKLNTTKVLSSEIKRNVALNGVPIENFGTHMNKLIPQSILGIGKKRSRTLKYKLTPFGEAKAQELMNNLVKNDSKKNN